MKTLIVSIYLLVVGVITAFSQPLFFKYAAPQDTINKYFSPEYIVDTPHVNYLTVEIDSANESTFRQIAPQYVKHIYDILQEGKPLRKRVDQILTISGNNVLVEYVLVDDRTGLPADGSSLFATSTDNGITYVWPSAGVQSNSAQEGIYDGSIKMGEIAGKRISSGWPGGIKAWESTALHEVLHTQFVGAFTKWFYVSQVNVAYGNDDSHYQEELLGDQSSAFEEGFGTFFSRMYNVAERSSGADFFEDTTHRYFVEAQSFMAGQKDLYSVKNRIKDKVNGTDIFRYRWQDIPGKYLLFSESTTSYFMVAFWLSINENPEQALEMIIDMAADMHKDYKKRNLGFAINHLALQLEAYSAMPSAQKLENDGILTSSMFPFALLDILTHFGMSEDEYKKQVIRNNPVELSMAFKEYWKHRAHVRAIFDKALSEDPTFAGQAVDRAQEYFTKKHTILKNAGPELMDPFEDQ